MKTAISPSVKQAALAVPSMDVWVRNQTTGHRDSLAYARLNKPGKVAARQKTLDEAEARWALVWRIAHGEPAPKWMPLLSEGEWFEAEQ